MATIEQYLSDVKSAIYGEDVRGSIVSAIQAINNENETLRSSVTTQVQNTLENYQIYELVENLPAVGNQSKIYAKMDLEEVDADSNNGADGTYGTWSSLQSVPYIQAAIKPECYSDDNANATKPAMVRYYMHNAVVSHQSGNQTLKFLRFENRDFIAIDITSKQQVLTAAAISGGSFIPSNRIPIGTQTLNGIGLQLTFYEFVYDTSDRLWKYNNTRQLSVSNISATRVSLTEFKFDIRNTSSDDKFNAIVFLQFPINLSDTVPYRVVYNGYSYPKTSTQIQAVGLCKTAYDIYGYETNKHTDGYAISCKSSNSYTLYGIGATIPSSPGTPYNWTVKIPSQSIAQMYIWSDALGSYLRLSGAIDPTDIYPNGYTRTIQTTDWDQISGGTEYTCTISDITLSDSQSYMISVSPDPSSKTVYVNNNIYCSANTSSGLIFVADTQPSSAITIGIVVQKINGDTVINNE